MPFTLLVLFAREGGDGRAALVLGEALQEIGVETDVAGLGLGSLGGAHASHSEGADKILVAKLDEAPRFVAEEAHDHIARDAHLVRVLSS